MKSKTVHICNKCGTVTISGNQKCPNCGANEQTGWRRIDIQKSRTDERSARLTNAFSTVFRNFRNHWQSVAAVIAIAALLFYMLPFGLAILMIILTAAAAIGCRMIANRRTPRNKRLYTKLLNKAGGDKALVSRLIENEHLRNPDADINEWLEDAIIRWERDLK